MKARGTGIALGLYPTGIPYGGDFSQAIVKVKHDGSVNLLVGSVDIGQGAKTVLAQMVAEELEIDLDLVSVLNEDTETSPMCVGAFASRITYCDGLAVLQAAREAKAILLEVAAEILGAPPGELEAGQGRIFVSRQPERSVPIAEVAFKATYQFNRIIAGRGHYMRPKVSLDPETGAIDPFATLAWGASLAEVEVDTETGEVAVLRLVCAYDVGRAINPLLVEGQIQGGTAMALGSALMEQFQPCYPSLDRQPETLGDYVIPTAVDVPEIRTRIVECPSTNGPFGAKGFGEMTANPPAPAIVSAVHDAVGVWIDELPLTPEKILRALDQKSAPADQPAKRVVP